jgi:hypothetical protein
MQIARSKNYTNSLNTVGWTKKIQLRKHGSPYAVSWEYNIQIQWNIQH